MGDAHTRKGRAVRKKQGHRLQHLNRWRQPHLAEGELLFYHLRKGSEHRLLCGATDHMCCSTDLPV